MKFPTVLLSSLFASATFGLAVAAPVAAEPAPKQTTAQVIGTVRIDSKNPTIATVHARYLCSGTPEQVHLWVSVKQTADRTADPRLSQEGSSTIAAAWSDSHRDPVTCDGKWHTDTFTVDQLERGTPNTFGPLAKGKAWVQFCLFDATTTTEPISSMEFVNIN
jgi:hypothetical protein